jgi:hypothetical protein
LLRCQESRATPVGREFIYSDDGARRRVSRIVGSSSTSPEKLGAEPFGFQADAVHAKKISLRPPQCGHMK